MSNTDRLLQSKILSLSQHHGDQPRPAESGQIAVFAIEDKSWRKDNQSYSKRKNNDSTQEHQMKLKIKGEDAMICSYCCGDGIKTASTFRRRAYWLINNPKYVFLHYLDTDLANSIKQQQQEQPVSQTTDTLGRTETKSTTQAKSSNSKDWPQIEDDGDEAYMGVPVSPINAQNNNFTNQFSTSQADYINQYEEEMKYVEALTPLGPRHDANNTDFFNHFDNSPLDIDKYEDNDARAFQKP